MKNKLRMMKKVFVFGRWEKIDGIYKAHAAFILWCFVKKFFEEFFSNKSLN
jgi:hypothetical protein